jgi:dihydrofolate reductase
MGKIILYMFTSVDGFIAGPNGEADDHEPSEEEHRFANELFDAADALLFGRVTYEGFIAYWDTLDLRDRSIPVVERDFAEIFRRKQRVVFSRTLEQVDPKARLIKDNLATEVTALKQQPGGDLLLICGPELLATLVDLGLVDEYLLLVKPTALGRGKALFGALQNKLRLSLVSTRVFASGAVLHHYAGAPQ